MRPLIKSLLQLSRFKEMPDQALDFIQDWIGEIEESQIVAPRPVVHPTQISDQAPSMQRLMQENPDLAPKPPQPVTVAAAQALMARDALMNSRGVEPGRKSPRKV